MADLVFTTKGQAEALAAQEAIAQKGRAIKQEFEEGNKAVGKWNSELGKLKSAAESALRSVQTEQEKIADQITRIKEAQEKGVIPVQQAEEAVARLRERWIEADEATKKQREDAERAAAATQRVADEHLRLKTSAETALRSVQTEEEKVRAEMEAIEVQIGEVEEAMKQGLVPPAQAEEGIKRLRRRVGELEQSVNDAGDSIAAKLEKAFSIEPIIKAGLKFVGVGAAVKALQEEVKDHQVNINFVVETQRKRYEANEKRIAELAAIEQGEPPTATADGEPPKSTKPGRPLTADEEAEMHRLLEERKRLGPRVKVSKGLSLATENAAVAQGDQPLSEAEEAEVDRLLALSGQSKGTRRWRRFTQEAQGYSWFTQSREEAAERIEQAAAEAQASGRGVFGYGAATGEEARSLQELLREMKAAVEILRGIDRKDGDLINGSE